MKKYNGQPLFNTKKIGEKYTKKNGSFYVKNVNDGKLRLYTKKNKTAYKIKTLSPRSSSLSTAFVSNDSSELFKRKHKKRRTTSYKSVNGRGKINRKLCGKNYETNRCRYVRGSESKSKNCHVNNKTLRCNKTSRTDRTKCGRNKSTNRCIFLQKGRNESKKCKLHQGKCIKVASERQ
jgi:hypothetical protein